jgi:hypothetical protein
MLGEMGMLSLITSVFSAVKVFIILADGEENV